MSEWRDRYMAILDLLDGYWRAEILIVLKWKDRRGIVHAEDEPEPVSVSWLSAQLAAMCEGEGLPTLQWSSE